MKDCICISLADNILKVVQIKQGAGNPKVVNLFARDFDQVKESEMSKVIQQSLKGFNIRGSQVAFLVPPSMTTTKNIEIPSINVEEINSIVNLQASRHTPFSREEIQTGYLNLGIFKNNYTKVLLVIANRNLLRNQLGVLEKAKVKIHKVLFAPEAVGLFYAKSTSGVPTGIIDVGKNSTSFTILSNGAAVATRNIGIGITHLMSEGDVANQKLTEELQKTLDAYISEDIDQVPTRFVITDSDPILQDLVNSIKTKLSWNIEISSCVDNSQINKGLLKKLSTNYVHNSFLNEIASAAYFNSVSINLIPEEVQLQKSIKDQEKAFFGATALGFTILLLIAIMFGVKIYYKKSYLDKLVNNFKDDHQAVETLQNQVEQSRLIKGFVNNRMVGNDILNELYRFIPKDVYLTRIAMDDIDTVSIQGVAETSSMVYNLNSSFKDSDLFKSSIVKSKSAKKDRGKDANAFEIVLKLVNEVVEEKNQESNKK